MVVPTEGGIAEMVTDGVNGYKIDMTDLDGIERRVEGLLSDREGYERMADEALHRARQYDAEAMIAAVMNELKL